MTSMADTAARSAIAGDAATPSAHIVRISGRMVEMRVEGQAPKARDLFVGLDDSDLRIEIATLPGLGLARARACAVPRAAGGARRPTARDRGRNRDAGGAGDTRPNAEPVRRAGRWRPAVYGRAAALDPARPARPLIRLVGRISRLRIGLSVSVLPPIVAGTGRVNSYPREPLCQRGGFPSLVIVLRLRVSDQNIPTFREELADDAIDLFLHPGRDVR